jgi:hypothetical protein
MAFAGLKLRVSPQGASRAKKTYLIVALYECVAVTPNIAPLQGASPRRAVPRVETLG